MEEDSMPHEKEPDRSRKSARGKKAIDGGRKVAGTPGGARRPFPSVTLAKALPVAQKIKELNGGNPWSPESIARALDVGAKSAKFYYLTAATRDFGLTTGTRDSAMIALTQLG